MAAPPGKGWPGRCVTANALRDLNERKFPMHVFLQKLLACCLLFCFLLAPARAEMPVPVSDRYEVELDLLNRYLQRNTDDTEGLDIHAVYEEFAANGNIGEFATEFMLYAEVLCFIEDGDFAAARRGVENLQSSASFEAFRAYLRDGEELTAAGRFAIRPLDELEAYVLARECEAQGRYAEAAEYYDYCQKFFDSYSRMRYALSVTPTPSPSPSPTPVPTPSPTPSPTPTLAPTPGNSNILASRFVECFSDADAVRANTREIRFLSTLRDAPADAIDVSQERDGSVQAWFEGDVLYVAANGTIYAPEDSRMLFCFRYTTYYMTVPLLKKIDFGGYFDTGNVTNMAAMFDGCSSLTELDVSSFDTGNVTNMAAMFRGCSSLTELAVSGFDTGNVTDMWAMFNGCSSLTELDVSSFDTGNVTDMYSMFAGCSSLTELDVSGFDTGNVTDMRRMFYNCSSLTELDVRGFDTGNVTDMWAMFNGCSSLTELDVSSFDTGNVTDMYSMFAGCSNLTELDVSGFDTGNVTDMSYMFCDCENLFSLDTSNFDMRSVIDDDYMFENCPAYV